MNNKKFFLFIMFFQLSSNLIVAAPINAPVEIYFLPENLEAMNQKLNTLLDGAKEQVLVAMYWLTDQKIINKFINLQKRGIDVQIIYDESAANAEALLEQLTKHNIFPDILPKINGVMHNKFLVIDEKITLTGSANFTKTVLGPSLEFFNNENVLIFDSEEIAKKYAEEFFNIETEIADVYLELLANESPNHLPDWIKKITLALYENVPAFVELIKERYYKEYNQIQKNRLKNFFPHLVTRIQAKVPPSAQHAEQVSNYQKNILLQAGFLDDEINIMNYDEALGLVNQIQKQDKFMFPQEISQPAGQQANPSDLPSQAQINLLQKFGYPKNKINQLSKRSAGAVISKFKKGQKPY